jgi:hypothetical protein
VGKAIFISRASAEGHPKACGVDYRSYAAAPGAGPMQSHYNELVNLTHQATAIPPTLQARVPPKTLRGLPVPHHVASCRLQAYSPRRSRFKLPLASVVERHIFCDRNGIAVALVFRGGLLGTRRRAALPARHWQGLAGRTAAAP